jgi:Tfp pilus assembly protein PilV
MRFVLEALFCVSARARARAGLARCARKQRAGQSLLELQIAVVLLIVALCGIAAILVTELSQLEWTEKRRQLYTYLPMASPQAIFTELTFNQQPSLATQQVNVQSISVGASSVTAVVTLEAR